MIAGASPSRTSVNANDTLSGASAMSHAPTMPMPPARTAPVEARDDRLGQFEDRAQQREHPLRPGFRAALARLLLEVGAGAEDGAGVREHDGAHGIVGRGRSRCAVSSVTSWVESALRFAGESSVIVAIARSTS